MTIEKTLAAFVALHSPESVKESMVYEVWEDGEITLTKGGRRCGLPHCLDLLTGGLK